ERGVERDPGPSEVALAMDDEGRDGTGGGELPGGRPELDDGGGESVGAAGELGGERAPGDADPVPVEPRVGEGGVEQGEHGSGLTGVALDDGGPGRDGDLDVVLQRPA